MIRGTDVVLPARRRARSRLDDLAGAVVAGSGAAPGGDTGGGPRVEVVAGGVVGGLVLVSTVGPPLTVVLGAGGAAGWLWWRQHRRQELARVRQAQLPEALERLASALRSGSSLPQALTEAGGNVPPPLGPELGDLGRATQRGRPLLDVLDGWAGAHDDHGTRLAATALALAAGIGAAPARAIDGVAATLRERLEVAGERHALATQARTSAVVLSAAPVGFALLLGVTDAAAARFLLTNPLGWISLVTGIGLDLAGLVWMTRLTRTGDVR